MTQKPTSLTPSEVGALARLIYSGQADLSSVVRLCAIGLPGGLILSILRERRRPSHS